LFFPARSCTFCPQEGKEYNQGVAYLDDGTMVVVDNARKAIGKTIDISVTSVLQTTAGKMIFGKWDERMAQRTDQVARPEPRPPQPATEIKKAAADCHGTTERVRSAASTLRKSPPCR